ncbi:DsbA family protein [uncultured Methanobrevibacter sp.]|uniref:DsbA family oxidoreductase n=1 Tax=uncultured Methanobrevibacter sp. TaxID=253161 RepID=UPI0026358F18|nr:DsbA family protein [uncultured Methanobrevibacter sp.]
MRIVYLIDFNCPSSYIGLERIKRAVENLNLDVEWEMRAFELEDEAKKKPTMSTTERYAEKYELSMDEAEKRIAEIENIALEDGLKINFADMPLTSSKDALRLAKYTQNMQPEVTLKLAEEIFHARFVENENIADENVLTQIAVSCGIEEDAAKKIIENNYYNIECFLDMEEALSNGITATPCFIVFKNDEKLIIPGTFSAEEFEIALKDFESGEIEDKTFI